MDFNSNITNDFITNHLDGRITGADDACTAETVREKVSDWRRLGAYVVANAGAYDILGLNHLRGLTQARIIGASYRLGNSENLDDIYNLAVSDEIRLLVSVDTNDALAENKSYQSTSGGSVRPTLDWQTRATMLSLQAIGGRHDLVDFVTRHGPGSCCACPDETCWHSNAAYSVASSGADLTITKSLSKATRDQYSDSKFHVIDECDGAFVDKVLGSQISTTALIRRVRQDKEKIL